MQNVTANSGRRRAFMGWWMVAAGFVTFGIAVGVPYYNLFFFYDYFQSSFKWSIEQITLGFPVASLLTIWAGPLLIPRGSPRKLIIVGTGLTAVAFVGFGLMKGSLARSTFYCILSIRSAISPPGRFHTNCWSRIGFTRSAEPQWG